MYFFHFDKNKSLKTLFEVIFYEKIFMTFWLTNHADSIERCA